MESNSIYGTPAGEKEVMSFYDSILHEWHVPSEIIQGIGHVLINMSHRIIPFLMDKN